MERGSWIVEGRRGKELKEKGERRGKVQRERG
jgi:hypothetical protein